MPVTQTVSLVQHYQNQSLLVKNIVNEFKKPIFNNVFFINLGILRSQANLYTFSNNRWDQRPWIFCQDIYGESGMYPLILLVNNIKSFLEFTIDRFPANVKKERIIIAPYESVIQKILNTTSN